MLTRRALMVSSLAAGACATAPVETADGEPADAVFRGLASPSESVHSGVASEDGEQRLTVRLCRYPVIGLAWVWMHARVGGQFYSYVDHLAPCENTPTPSDQVVTSYADMKRALVFERRGAVDRPTVATVTGSCRARRSAESRFGQGDRKLEVSIAFTPKRLYSGLNVGRTEVFGHSRASVKVDGKEFVIEGPGQFHEQRQATPRFGAPFCYMTLWGADAASTMLIGTARRDGYLLEGDLPGSGKSTEVEAVTLDPPGKDVRALHVKLADGRTLEGEARVVQAYTIPMVGNTWRGHMVKAELGGRTFMGHINDYIIGAGVPYSA